MDCFLFLGGKNLGNEILTKIRHYFYGCLSTFFGVIFFSLIMVNFVKLIFMDYSNNIITSFYLLTFKIGFCGNLWVICSVYRSRRPHTGSLTPSDRLRSYILMLAVVDLFVVCSSSFRFYYTIQPILPIDTANCRIIFIVDYFVKLCSITCLVCISVERYITIRKPFNSKTRKRFIKMTPFVAIFILFFMMCAICLISVEVMASGRNGAENCSQTTGSGRFGLADLARCIVAVIFLTKLFVVTISYGQIVRHVRQTFWQRKARANSARASSATPGSIKDGKPPLVIAEPRYMRDMTAAIVRIACFHVICWLPYCLVQFMPNNVQLHNGSPLSIHTTTSVRLMSIKGWADPLSWAGFIADWLTYVNSAGDWIFYAAMNRDLRSIIRANTERRKRSTLSQQSPSSNLHRSLRRQMSQSLKFFYSINSYRSNGNSYEETCSIVQNGGGHSMIGSPTNQYKPFSNSKKNVTRSSLLSVDSPNGSLSPPIIVNKCHSNSIGLHGPSEGLFGMRNGRAHTYCTPRTPSRLSNASSISSPQPLNGCLKGRVSPTQKQLLWLANGANGCSSPRKVSINSQVSISSGNNVPPYKAPLAPSISITPPPVEEKPLLEKRNLFTKHIHAFIAPLRQINNRRANLI